MLEREGLFYAPDPNSLDSCRIGGNLAENAGGPRPFKSGVTRDWVLGLEACLMGGRVVKTGRRTVKGVTGYDVIPASPTRAAPRLPCGRRRVRAPAGRRAGAHSGGVRGQNS